MSANLHTFIEFEGNTDEIKAMLAIIQKFSDFHSDVALEDTRIHYKRQFDGKHDISLEKLSDEVLNGFLKKCKNKVFVCAEGPYGSYGRVDEAGVFEAISEATPGAKFEATTSGFTTGQSEDYVGELKEGILYLTYSFLPDEFNDYDDEDDECEECNENWITEKKRI